MDPTQTLEARSQRLASFATTKRADDAWDATHPDAARDSELFRQQIQPGLAHVRISAMRDVTGLSQAACSTIRSGPAPRTRGIGKPSDSSCHCTWLTSVREGRPVTIETLQTQLREFADDGDWQQFHEPQNLILALVGEVGELAELFQWLTPDEGRTTMKDPAKSARVREELADVFGYVLRLADILGVELEAALVEKITANARKYRSNSAQAQQLSTRNWRTSRCL
jgi:NTP pyrophosphatase (non-canonical NTP hydrolase)